MHDDAGARELAEEYGRLKRLENGLTPQARGQRFNELIADLLRYRGIAAGSSLRGAGEIDVAFTVDGTRYVLEAKWQKAKADTGHLAKLQKRLRQRFAGTRGVFLSMSGYTPEALKDVAHGERLEILLLDQEHFEAMLTGICPPQDLLAQLHDRASFQGETYTPMAAIQASPSRAGTATGPRPRTEPEPAGREASAGVKPREASWDISRTDRANPAAELVTIRSTHLNRAMAAAFTVGILELHGDQHSLRHALRTHGRERAGDST